MNDNECIIKKLWVIKLQFYTIVTQKLEKAENHDTIIKLYYNALRFMILIRISKGAEKKKLINDYIPSMIHQRNEMYRHTKGRQKQARGKGP